jgi:hypothetical protein
MDIRDFLSLNSSRLNADILADKIEEDPDVFETVLEIMLEDTYPRSMRAGHAIYIFAKKHPYFLEPRAAELIRALPSLANESVIRNVLGVLCLVKLPPDMSGLLFDYCYEILEKPGAAIAHKAYSMTILYNISEMEPELKPELVSLLEEQLEIDSAGIKSRANNILKKLYREI